MIYLTLSILFATWQEPDTENNFNNLIPELFKSKSYEQIANIFEQNETYDFNYEALQTVGKSYYLNNDFRKSSTIFLNLIDRNLLADPNNSFVDYTYLAACLERLGKVDSSLNYYSLANIEAKKTGDENYLAMSIENLSFLLGKKGNHIQSISLKNEAIRIYQNSGDSINLMTTYASKGTAYVKLGILDSALHLANVAYDYFKRNPHPYWSWQSAFKLANIEQELKNIDAVKYFREALDLSGDDLSNKLLSLSGIGNALLDQGNDSCYYYLKEAYDLAINSKYNAELSEITLTLTRYHTFQRPNLNLIKEFLDKSRKILGERNDITGSISLIINESEYFKLSDDISKSILTIDSAIHLAKTYELKNKISEALSQKFRVLNHFGRYKEALEVKEEEIKVQQELFNDRSEAVYQILRTQNEMDKQESTIANQQLEIDNNNLQITIMYISIALVISALVFIFWQYRTRSKYAKKLETMFLDSRHRYMNNLLLLKNWFNEGKTENNDEIISFAQNRIDAISTVNRHLDRLSYNKDTIESKSFLEDISHNLLANREFTSEIENVPINMSVSGPLGMITNEIITNGLKYGEEPYAIRFHKNGKGYILEIEDHGPGIADPEKKGTGSKVLRLLSRQLKGELTYQNKADLSPESHGTLVSLNFKG